MTQSIILATTQTSGTGSLMRILRMIAGRHYRCVHDNDIPPADLDPSGHVYFFNNQESVGALVGHAGFRHLFNFRDPRDRLCNVYQWRLSLPSRETPGQRARRIARIEGMGIDAWVRAAAARPHQGRYFDNILALADFARDTGRDHAVASYARLCCDFDGLVTLLAGFLGTPLDDALWRQLEPERPEHLRANSKWVGNRLPGADIRPGRYRSELSPETIAALNARFADTLRRMAAHDPLYAHQYLEGLTG